MSHVPTRNKEKSRRNKMRLIERTVKIQQEMRSVTSLKVRMMEEAVGSLKSQNPPPMKRTFPNPGYVRRSIHSLHGSVTSNSPRGSACQPMSKHMMGPEIQKTTSKYFKPLPRWNVGKQISRLVSLGDGEHFTSARINLMVVRSPSPYNGIIGRPGLRNIQAVPSTAHGMLKFQKHHLSSLPMNQQQKRSKSGDPPGVSRTDRHHRRKPIRKRKDGTFNYGVTGEDMLKGMHFGAQMKSSRKSTDLTANTPYNSRPIRHFIMKRPDEDAPPTKIPKEEEVSEPWTLFTDGSSCLEGSGAGLILTNLEGMKFTYALRSEFVASNNEVEYEAMMAGLRITKQMGLKKLAAKVDSRLVANQINGSYIEKDPKKREQEVDALSKIASTSFAHLTKQVLVKVPKENSIDEKEVFSIVEEERHIWMTPLHEYLMGEYVMREIHEWYCSMHSGPKYVVAKVIRSRLVERVNYNLGEGTKERLDQESKNWFEEVPYVLWAHRTMIKTSNSDTPFSLTYGTEAVISVEIGMPSLRCTKVDQVLNDKALLLNLDILEEKRERVANLEAKS
uniref:Reverse transcriptase domain-containing protein n=1 Tax=Tanacetum cinerariifolium TaxID=118510 RepID=A0A699HKF1_TANCI|nr:reverse transcriptase domain-containing protein [Tanacetum cinerariifolium]